MILHYARYYDCANCYGEEELAKQEKFDAQRAKERAAEEYFVLQ